MKVFQCSSSGLVPSIPTVLPPCCSIQTAATLPGSDYPGIFPLSASYAQDGAAAQNPAGVFAQTVPSAKSDAVSLSDSKDSAVLQAAANPPVEDKSVPEAGAAAPSMAFEPAAEAAAPSSSGESATLQTTGSPSMAYERVPEAEASSPSMPVEQTAAGSAVQFLLRDSQAQNAAALSLQPQVISGNDIRFTGQQLTFAPNGLYFISLLLSAQVGTSGFGEVIPQIAGALRREYAAYASTSSQSGTAGLCSSFLLNTAGQREAVPLEFIFHTSALRGVPVQGSLTAFKVGTPAVIQ